MPFNIPIKCPICGEDKNIISLGKVNIEGLDPVMESYQCDREYIEYDDKKQWGTVKKRVSIP